MTVQNIIINILFFSLFLSCHAKYKASKDATTFVEKTILNTKDTKLRVVAGIQDISDKFPYVVALGRKLKLEGKYSNLYPEFRPTCTGNLINARWVLTAAHCLRILPTLIRYGNFLVPPNDTFATYSEVLKGIQHPSFLSSRSMYYRYSKNDIGLLMVTETQLNVYGRISAVDFSTLVGLPVVYVGFGGANVSGETLLTKQLRRRAYGEAVVMPCPRSIVSTPVICLASKCSNKPQQAFYGDSGGPLLQAGLIVGVCKDGFREGPYAKPIVKYTSVSPFIDWITITMRTLSP